MFGLGAGEIFLIVFVFLLLFGSKKIPELAKGLGKGIREFKDAASNVQNEIKDSVKDVKETQDLKDLKKLKDDLDITKDIKI